LSGITINPKTQDGHNHGIGHSAADADGSGNARGARLDCIFGKSLLIFAEECDIIKEKHS